MSPRPRASAALLSLAFSVPLVMATDALAGIGDYEFQLAGDDASVGEATLDLRLIDKRTGEPVPNAVVFVARVDMAPDGMRTMASAVEPLPSPRPGLYRFRTELTMAGNWRLSLGAKVQGEVGTLVNELVFKVAK